MLYDERWDKETKPKTKWQKILLDAADDLETNGWCQGNFGRPSKYRGVVKVSHCALGAIRNVGRTRNDIYQYQAEAEAELEKALDDMPIVSWNDHPDRTKEEVVAKLREVASSTFKI